MTDITIVRHNRKSELMAITIFTWGYYGWGNHTPELVKAVDSVELNRGFKPALFVDIRIRRSVRAAGFTGSQFEKLLGQDRYRWMKSLGNKFIETRTGPSIQIAHPEAAEELLDLAIDAGSSGQRVIFFCSCRWPRCNKEINCHRTTVANLILKAARRREVSLKVEEWPGNNPQRIDLEVSAKEFDAIQKGGVSLPLGKKIDLATVAALPWCSIATVHSNGERLHRIVGPAIHQTSGWRLPVLYPYFDPSTNLAEYQRQAQKLRVEFGFNAARS